MQADGVWLSIGLGVALGIVYVAASYLSNKRALKSKRNAMMIVVATMLVRIVAALAVLVAVLVLLPVAPTALLGSFFVMFIAGLALEVWHLHKEAPSDASDSTL